jgi:hypothetical protein
MKRCYREPLSLSLSLSLDLLQPGAQYSYICHFKDLQKIKQIKCWLYILLNNTVTEDLAFRKKNTNKQCIIAFEWTHYRSEVEEEL